MCKAIGHLIDELRAGDVHAVHDGVLLRAEDAVGLAAGLEHVHLNVLLHHQPDLLQQGVQVLLHTPGAVHVQVKELRDLQQVGHLLRVCLVLRRVETERQELDKEAEDRKKHKSTANTCFCIPV